MLWQLVMQVGVPLLMTVDLWFRRFASRLDWALNVLMWAALIGLCVLIARWDLTSYYLRIVWPLVLIGGAIRAYLRGFGFDETVSKYSQWAGRLWAGFLFGVAAYVSVSALSGYTTSEPALELRFPLRNGTFYVGGGGTSRWINNHHVFPPQTYALDIVQLNSFGRASSGWQPEELEQYTIFGQEVYSPCAGVVIDARNARPDLIPPQRDTFEVAGNYVVVECDNTDVTLVLAHLQSGSVQVTPGEVVTTDTLLGQVGNSGNTTQPHLHIHAEQGGAADRLLDGKGVPLRFDSRFLVRNSLVFAEE